MALSYRGFASQLVLLIALGALTLEGQSDLQKISLEQAQKLVYEAIKVQNPGAKVTRTQNAYDPEFFYFEATWPNPIGSPVIGHFSVNPWTGDVWNPGLCERITSPSLSKIQRGIKKRLKLKKEDYAKMHAKKPICS